MNWLSTRMRITIGLACLTLSVLLLSMLIGVLPDREKAVLEGRRTLCEAIAVNSSIMVSQQDLARLQAVLQVTAERNPDILSAGLRRDDGKLLVEVGDHSAQWKAPDDRHSIDTQVQVPIHAGDGAPGAAGRWGNVEIRFRPVSPQGVTGLLFGPRPRLLWFVCGSCFVLFFFYMTKMLEYLDPSQAVPGHVRSALDTLAEGLLVIDGRDRIVLANGAFAAMVGKSPEKLLGHVASHLPWVQEKENGPPAALPWTVALREKAAKTNVLLRLQTIGGKLRTFIVNSSPVLGSKGQYRGVLASFDDVTDLEEKECELRKAVESADAANRTKSEFLANMSHEIRTPMNAILGFADVLRRGLAADEPTRRHYLDTIHSSGKHLLELINDILDLSKIEAGRLEIERKRCAPCELISELVTMFTVPAQDRGISLEFNSAGPVPETVLTDPTRLRQIVANLVGNAIKFTETGGVKIVARLLPDAAKPQLAIDVIDSGIGISPEGLKRIFNPFVQADSSVTRRFGGTGLGLAISRRFAAALGGDITVASELGKGSTFTVTLDAGPLDGVRLLDGPPAQTSSARSGSRSANLPKLPPARVLVADDGEANRQLIEVVLTRAGVQVESAENGEVAVRMATGRHYDLILMDMQMPVMDGYAATTRLRQQGLSIPIVALTASVMKGSEGRCGAAGCSAYIAKPVDIDELMRCLAELLQGSKSIAPRPPGSDAQRSGLAGEEGGEAEAARPAPLPPPREAARRRPPLVSRLPMDDPDFRQIVAGFIPRLRQQAAAMQAAWEQRDLDELVRLAHWLKGAGGTVGFDALTGPAKELELLAKQKQVDEIGEALDEVLGMIGSAALPAAGPALCQASP
jgi:PAS domain S-box-containing protein